MLGTPLHADHRALVAAEDHQIAVIRIDPQLMVVVATRRSLERLAEGLAAVARSIDAGVRRVHEVGILRIDDDLAKVPAASPDARISRRLHERRARIVRSVQTAILCIDDRVDPPRIRRRDRDADASEPFGRQAVSQLIPDRAAVRGFVEAAAGAVRRRINAPRWTPRIPERGVDRLRVRRIDGDVDRADVVALEQHLLPRRAAVSRAIHAAVRIAAVGMTDRRDEHDIGILWIDGHPTDLPRVVETDVGPVLAGIGGLIHPVAVRDLRPHVAFTGADVDDVRIRIRDGDGANRRHRLRIEDRQPGPPRVRRLPDAAADRAHVERVGLARHAADAVHAPAAEGTEHAPAQA